ncbi:MAG TPA: TetR/AcrR family transcriptional regulator [Blastocatellia bacterium]
MGAIATSKTQARMTGEDRRRQIVDISAELFSQKGFNGTTTKEIADRAGVSEAIIFRHFPNKRALYSAIIDYKTRQNSERVQERLEEAASRKDDRAFFGALALEMLDAHLADPTLMRLLMFSALEGHELAEMFFQSTAQDVRNSVLRYIKQRIADRAFRSVDPKVCSRAFIGMILFHAQVRVIYKNTDCDDIKLSNKQMAERFVDIFLEGIRRDETKRSIRR